MTEESIEVCEIQSDTRHKVVGPPPVGASPAVLQVEDDDASVRSVTSSNDDNQDSDRSSNQGTGRPLVN